MSNFDFEYSIFGHSIEYLINRSLVPIRNKSTLCNIKLNHEAVWPFDCAG